MSPANPLLELLESYVLDCLGALPPNRAAQLRVVVVRVFGDVDDWRTRLRTELGLGDDLDGSLRELWEKNLAIARAEGVELTPESFARMVVQENFAAMLA